MTAATQNNPAQDNPNQDDAAYRPCVGIALFNQSGRVFIGRRRNRAQKDQSAPGFEWQMPQGGIDDGEEPLMAARRELQEETGVVSASLLGQSPDWYSYDLPDDISKFSWKGRFRGQRQKWFAFRLDGPDTEINISSALPGLKPEFDRWRWEQLDRLPQLIIPFKRAVYERVVVDFRLFAA